jgi:hypothetical protein
MQFILFPAAGMEEIERTLLVKPEVFVYKIGPRPSAKGYRAADWNLAAPDWTGRLRCLVKGNDCEMRLEDKSSGELFAACPVEKYPGGSVESVTDSSRYFVICIKASIIMVKSSFIAFIDGFYFCCRTVPKRPTSGWASPTAPTLSI